MRDPNDARLFNITVDITYTARKKGELNTIFQTVKSVPIIQKKISKVTYDRQCRFEYHGLEDGDECVHFLEAHKICLVLD